MSSTDRALLAEQQSFLADALAARNTPFIFDPKRLAATRRALARKRLSAIGHVAPALENALCTHLLEVWQSYVITHELSSANGATTDVLRLATQLRPELLPPTANVELASIQATWKLVSDTARRRRAGVSVVIISSGHVAVSCRLPVMGTRVSLIPVPRRCSPPLYT